MTSHVPQAPFDTKLRITGSNPRQVVSRDKVDAKVDPFGDHADPAVLDHWQRATFAGPNAAARPVRPTQPPPALLLPSHPIAARMVMLPPAVLARLRWQDGCLVWTGQLTANGYGQVKHEGANRSVHRLLLETVLGPLAGSHVHVHHTCGRKACAFVGHLLPLTAADHRRLHRLQQVPQVPAGHPVARPEPTLRDVQASSIPGHLGSSGPVPQPG